MKILFRADSSSKIGLGHVMRCLELAKKFDNSEIFFASKELKGNINQQIPYPLHVIKSNKAEEIIKLILSLHVNMLVIDNYDICYETEKIIKEKTGVKILVIDDLYRRHFCDILLNPNIYADKKKYKDLVPPFCELWCDCWQEFLRKEFKIQKSIKRKKIYDVLLIMGGSDSKNLNTKIVKILPQSLHVGVLTTTANANLDELKKFLSKRKNCTLHVNSNEVAKLLSMSKFVITTPSVTLHEVLFMGISFIAYESAKNQKYMSCFLEQNGYNVARSLKELKSLIDEKL
jgi:UDP-2,4-diacetamido-2,4,6-trideoxy-beta-L-altropyranose hydrolase